MLIHEISTLKLDDHALRPVTELHWTDDTGVRDFRLGSTITLGSDRSCGCMVAHPTVSRVHAELVPSPEGLWVRDLGSRNGVFVQNVRVREALARAGDELRFGAATVRTQAATAPARVPLWPYARFGDLLGQSETMRELFAKLAKVAATPLSVLVLGETGTGKELVARALHEASLRPKGPFLVVDCGALPENLMESELFGHEAGAFTGAQRARDGVFAAARGGTVFLDEIGELPALMQSRLLRVLESGEVKRVGANRYEKVDARVLAATHRDLHRMVNEGTFREDLYFRLAVVTVRVPSLRERREDIPLLVQHFAEGHEGERIDALVKAAMGAAWPGNLRDLKNFVMRSLVLGPELGGGDANEGPSDPLHIDVSEPYKVVRDRVVDHVERVYVEQLMAEHRGNVSAAARAAGMNRTWLHELIKRHAITGR